MSYSERWRRLFSQFKKLKNLTLTFLPGDSHSAAAEELVKSTLGERQIDFLFIDGDHTYEGVKQDFITYSRLVRSGGIIAFHDIRTVRPGCGVKDFWEEFSLTIPVENRWEFAHQDFGPTGAGIGVIKMA